MNLWFDRVYETQFLGQKRTMMELCKSNIPSVRKAVSISLKNFMKLNISSEAELCALLELVVKDNQEFVKIFAVEDLFVFAKLIGQNVHPTHTRNKTV